MSAPVSIDLTADSESEAEQPVKRRRFSPRPGPSEPEQPERPRLRAGFGYLRTKHIDEEANRGVMGVTLADLIDDGAKWILVSNYLFSMEFLLSACPSLLTAEHLVFAHGEHVKPHTTARKEAVTVRRDCSLQDLQDQPGILNMHRVLSASGHRSWVLTAPPQPLSFGTHHSKMFLVHCAAGVRVIVHTSNLIFCDINNKTQGVWWQDFPPKDAQSPQTSDFETELAAYVVALELDEQASWQAEELLASHDFSSARAALVPSVPGKHAGSSMHKVGHLRVRKLLQQCTFPAAFEGAPLVAQYSSVGSLSEPWLGGTLGLASAADSVPEGAPAGTPHLIWPTVAEVRDSLEGWGAGNSIPGMPNNVLKDFLQPLYHRFGGGPVGRERAVPHIKSYARYLPDGGVAWAMLASHNLSKAAWGHLQRRDSQLMVHSFEMGVLFVPDLELLYRQHRHHGYCCSTGLLMPATTVPETLSFCVGTAADVQQAPKEPTTEYIVLPYSLPPSAYTPGQDTPWTHGNLHPGLDCYGTLITDSRKGLYDHMLD